VSELELQKRTKPTSACPFKEDCWNSGIHADFTPLTEESVIRLSLWWPPIGDADCVTAAAVVVCVRDGLV